MMPNQSAPNFNLMSQNTNYQRTYYVEDTEKAQINQQLVSKLHTKLRVSSIRTLAHRFSARFWKQFDLGLNLPSTVLAAISGTSALSNSNSNPLFFVGAFGLVVAVLTSINTFLKPSNTSSEHLHLAAKYAALRNEIDLFLSRNSIAEDEKNEQYRPIKPTSDDYTEEIRQSFERLISEFNELEEKTPIPFEWATKKARNIILKKIDNEPKLEQDKQSNVGLGN